MDWLLRLGSAVLLTALGSVVKPFNSMNAIQRQTGLGELPHIPIGDHLTRSISALYVLHWRCSFSWRATCAGGCR